MRRLPKGSLSALFLLLLLASAFGACRADDVEQADVQPTSTPVAETSPATPTPQPPTATATSAPLPTATATAAPTPEPTETPPPAEEVFLPGLVTVHGDMNVRAGPGVDYPVVAGATLGQEFPVTGKNAAGDWWQIDMQGRVGWIFGPYVTAVDTENVPIVAAGDTVMTEKEAFVTVYGDMNVRSGPGTSFAIVGPAAYGQEFPITGQSEDGEWWRIDYDGGAGWIFAPLVDASNAENVAAVGSGETPAQANAFVTVNGEMNVRDGPGITYDIVGAATLGQEFPITGKSAAGDWWQIDFNGQTGWLYAPFVTAANTENVPVAGGGTAAPEEPRAVVNADMNVRAGPGADYDRIGGAALGKQYAITGRNESGEWFRLDFDGRHGWIYARFVTATGADNVPVVTAEPAPPAAQETAGDVKGEQAVVINVVDGDTLDLRFEDGTQERILLLDVDAPEIEGGVECFGGQASLFTNRFNGGKVGVERGGRDGLGRLLAYVWLADGRLLNEVLARHGYALFGGSGALGAPGPYGARIQAAAAEARRLGAGLWSQCPVDDAPTPTPAPAG